MKALPVVTFNGLRADSLGVYLASLGLFSLVARGWPSVRATWRNASFCLVGGPETLEKTVEYVSKIGQENTWTQYDKPWDKAKKKDVSEKTSRETALWRAREMDEQSLPLFGAHLALGQKLEMNPLLGTGGNAGRRDFRKGWDDAVTRLSKDACDVDLNAFLNGKACKFLDNFQAASWFGTSNKIYNNGTKRPHREGGITPWAMVLACEGLPYFSGGPSRQLGSQRHSKGAFPFVTTAMAPRSAGEAGSVEAEIWAPIWSQPMTVPELKSLFLRGRAEARGKGAVSSATFVAGIVGRGVDAGVVEFRRFLLLHTTSAQTFESRLATVVPVPKVTQGDPTTRAIQTIVELIKVLPLDHPKSGKRWQFSGVRGPLEQALVDFAATRPSEVRTEKAWALVDQMTEALTKVDQNRKFRSQDVHFRFLPGQWAVQLFKEDPPDQEARLALALASMTGFLDIPQLIAYRLGVEGVQKDKNLLWKFPESIPTRRVWSNTQLTDNLVAMAERRIVEALQKMISRSPFDGAIRVDINDMLAWLYGDIDENRMRLWIDRFCIFNWEGEVNRKATMELQRSFSFPDRAVADGALALYALFRPLASDWLLDQILEQTGSRPAKITTLNYLGQVVAMLRHCDINAAVEAALRAYRSMSVPIADFCLPRIEFDSSRMLAALLVPVLDKQVLAVFQCWRSPAQFKTE